MESSSLKFTRPYVTVISPDIDLDERKMVLFFPPILQEHFYDAASGSGYLAWRLKTVQRNNSRHTERKNKPNSEQGGPNIRRRQ